MGAEFQLSGKRVNQELSAAYCVVSWVLKSVIHTFLPRGLNVCITANDRSE
jgi:hypothetical protein